LTFIKESFLRWKRPVYLSRKILERNDKLLMMARSKRGLEREGEGGRGSYVKTLNVQCISKQLEARTWMQ